MSKLIPCHGYNCNKREACLRYALSHTARFGETFINEQKCLVEGRECPKFITNKTI